MVSYIEEINQFVWSLAIFILFTGAFIYLSHSLKREEKNEKLLMLGFTSASFGLAFNQFFLYLSRTIAPLEHFFDLLSILSFALGMTIFFYLYGRVMKKMKFLPFIINLILIPLLIIFFNGDLYLHARFFVYISYVFNATAFSFVLFLFSRNSSVRFRITSILLSTGAVVYLIGAVLGSIFIRVDFSISPLISYSFLIAGALLFVTPLFIKSKEKAQAKIALIICSITYIVCLSIALYFIIFLFIVYQVHYLFLISILVLFSGATIFFIHFLINLAKLIKSSETIDVENELEQKKDILSIFSRRKLINEEEISISKEKRTCLVCKTVLGREMYMCPNCYAFYCTNCSSTLSDIENACWVCNVPFDPSKPIKIFEDIQKEEDHKEKLKKIAIVTITDLDFYEKIEKFKWGEEEKKEFIRTMLALSPAERRNIINEILEMDETLNEEGSYF